jgi:NAD(P)-dependent dehydrogenase (short-subunit alcohol dehydrogenase family)
VRSLASEINKSGPFDAIIHNAGLYRLGGKNATSDNLPLLIAVNTFAPYMLSCLVTPAPKRLVYLSSGLHSGADASLNDITFQRRSYSDSSAYADSKFHNILFAKAFARRFAETKCNSMDPGWVATKMGGAGAPSSPDAAVDTYVYLATEVESTGGYWKPGVREADPKREAGDERVQEKLVKVCEDVTGVKCEGN